MTYQVERTHERTLTVRHMGIAAGWEQWYFLGSDVHYDHPLCDRRLFRTHMLEAKARGAGVFLFGDCLDGMQGRADPRASKDDLDPKYAFSDYVDRLVDETARDWAEFADVIKLISFGNHEGAVLKHNESNIGARLARALGTQFMGYSGYIRFLFQGKVGRRTSRLLYFHHGSGGNAPVTRGVIKTNRRSVVQDGVDILVAGHVHQQWIVCTPRIRMSGSGQPYKDKRYHVQCPTYKDEVDLLDVGLSWPDEKEFEPPLIGGWWMRFSYNPRFQGNIETNFMLAQ